MARVDRNNPIRSVSSESTYSLMEFIREYPNDAACLDYLWRKRYAPDGHTTTCPKCNRHGKFHRVKSRPSYSCDACGHHIHPTAGTIFHRSPTSLLLWFYAMYLMTSTRCAVSAKHLERELGVTYKVAWRMANKIRNELMTQDDEPPLDGNVEADESWVGGKPRQADRDRARRRAEAEGRPWKAKAYAMRPKTAVFGAVERGGRVRATVVPDSSAHALGGPLRAFVLPSAHLITDEWAAYNEVGSEFAQHDRINHGARVYVSGDVHTNTIEGFWATVKTGIRGNYHSVSRKWLQGYLNEFAWRYNRRYVVRENGKRIVRTTDRAMFHLLTERAVETTVPF
jgi:transposase-like protein